ncbi:MAG: alpha-ketoglutarate-dependent dioxygenase AlkB [Candidatus Baltobacteraceae bacterium]
MTLFGGCVVYRPAFLAIDEADRLFAAFAETLSWRQERARLFGRDVALPRLTAWYGDAGYRYSNVAHPPQPWTIELAALRDRVAEATGTAFNSVLLNRYRDGADGVAWHADDERELGDEPTIASLSLGATREFQFRTKGPERRERAALDLAHGSLLLMRGRSQRDLQHRIAKVSPPSAAAERINLTYRLVSPA